MNSVASDIPIFYTPQRIDRILRCWDEWTALAETPGSAHHLSRAPRPGPTPTDPRSARAKGQRADPTRYADVVADLEYAYEQLSSGGYGVQAVAAAMAGTRPSAFAQVVRARKADVLACYRGAVEKMSRVLEPGNGSAT